MMSAIPPAVEISPPRRCSVLLRGTTYLALVFIGLIAVAPMVQPFHALPLTSFYSEWLALLLGTTVCVLFLVRDSWQRLSIPRVSLYLLGLVALIAIQNLFVQHAYASQSLLSVFYLSWTILLATVASWLRTQLDVDYVVRVFAWFVLCGGLLHALVGLAQFIDYPGYLSAWIDYPNPGTTLSGNLSQSNHYASQLMLAAVALIYLFATGNLSFLLVSMLMVLLVFTITLSASRAVILYIAAILLLSVLGYRKTRDTVHLRFMGMSATLSVLFLLAQYLLPPFSEWLRGILVELGFQQNQLSLLTTLEKLRGAGGVDLRLSEWHKAWLMFLQSPVLGVGVGNYGWYSFVYQSAPEFAAIQKPELFHHSHNMFTQVLAEMGGIGLLLLIALLVGWIKQYAKDWLQPTHWFIGACLLVLFIHSNLEYPLWYSYFLGIAAVLLGLGDSRMIKVSFTPWLGQVTAGIALLLIAAILGITFTGYQKLANVNALILETNPEQAASALRQVANNPLLKPWAEAVMATHGITDKNMIEQQLALTTRVMLHHPNPIKVRRQIQYLALAKRTEEAVVLLRQAATAYPTHLPAYICLWQSIPDDELRPIVDEAQRLWNKPLQCESSDEPEPV